ncbi:hypothetical protein Tco_0300247, partial [Tanacetum coccineum]
MMNSSLQLITDERVFDDNPESHSGSMSSMKNLDDTYVDTKVGRSLIRPAHQENKAPLGLPWDCLPRLSSGVR